MTNDEYQMTHDLLKGIVSQIGLLPLEDFINQCERYETAGMLFVAPVTFQRSYDGVELMKRLAQELLMVKRMAQEHDRNVLAAREPTP